MTLFPKRRRMAIENAKPSMRKAKHKKTIQNREQVLQKYREAPKHTTATTATTTVTTTATTARETAKREREKTATKQLKNRLFPVATLRNFNSNGYNQPIKAFEVRFEYLNL